LDLLLIKIILALAIFYIVKQFSESNTLSLFRLTGLPFLVLGLLLNENVVGLELWSVNTRDFHWLILLVISLLGLRYGLYFKFSDFGKLNSYVFKIALFDIVLSFLVVFSGLLTFSYFVFPENLMEQEFLIFISSISVISIISSLTITKYGLMADAKKTVLGELIEKSIGFQQVVAIYLFGLIFILFPLEKNYLIKDMQSFTWVFICTVSSFVLGLIFQLILSKESDIKHIRFYIFIIMLVSSVLSEFFSLSPLFISLIVGSVLSNSSRNAELLRGEIGQSSHIVTSILVFIAALNLSVPDWNLFLYFTIAYLGFRYLGKFLAQKIAFQLIVPNQRYSNQIYSVFWGQGRLAIALVVCLQQVYNNPYINTLMFIIITSVFFNEWVALKSYKNIEIDGEKFSGGLINKG
jgi:Kef-type K+ transport system membrane component KefB